jgi:hypothetical protein
MSTAEILNELPTDRYGDTTRIPNSVSAAIPTENWSSHPVTELSPRTRVRDVTSETTNSGVFYCNGFSDPTDAQSAFGWLMR